MSKSIDEITNHLMDFFSKFASWENSIIRTSDLGVSETHAIEILGRHEDEPLKMKRLAEKLGVTTGTLTVTVDRLEKRGYAKRVPFKGDRRAYVIQLTAKGREMYREHHHLHNKLTEQLLSHLTSKDVVALKRIFGIINEETI